MSAWVPPCSRAVKSGGLSHWLPTDTLLIVTLGWAFWNAAMSAFQCSRDFPPLSVFSGGQSTVIVTFAFAFASPDLLSLVHAARLSPTVAASASAPTVR